MIDKKNPLVSIIVPVYKVEKYLDRCVQSIISQTYKNIEVILVDDGSPDDCGIMCKNYSDQYDYIHMIQQKNGGQANARNNAVRIANGDCIFFVDSDDYITEDCIEYLVGLKNKYNADIAIGNYKCLYEGKQAVRVEGECKEYYLTVSDALARMNYGKGVGATPWAKLINADLVKNNPFTEDVIYEDLDTMYRIIGDTQTVVLGEKVIYYWIQRNGSTMRSEFSAKQLYGIEAAKHQLDYFAIRFPEIISAGKARYESKIAELTAIALKSKNSHKLYHDLKKQSMYYKEVMRDPNVKKTMKIRLLAMRLGYLPTKLVFTLHEKAKERKFSK